MAIRVLIIDDSATMRALLRVMIDREPDMDVAGEAADAMEGRAQIKALNPDVVTLDIEMPGNERPRFPREDHAPAPDAGHHRLDADP